MALTPFQRTLCRLLARRRIEGGESYVAGGAALGEATASTRLSRDIDLFHDTAEAVSASWDGDRSLLEAEGYRVGVVRERPTFVESVVGRAGESVLVQWAADSAYRFFPLVEHPDFGLALHPFDLATNKVLALVGRLEARDWVDVIVAHERIQQLGYLAWASCGKDPGFSPGSILDNAARSARYTQDEVAALAFSGPAPSARDLSRSWHAMLDEARKLVSMLPAAHAGTCVTRLSGDLWRGDAAELAEALAGDQVRFRTGSLRGALPELRGA